MKRALLLVLLVAGCSSAGPTPQIVYVTAPPVVQPTPQIVYVTPAPVTATAASAPHAITGAFHLHGLTNWTAIDKTHCVGTSGYRDFGPGMAVTVKDESGTVIATSATAYDPTSDTYGNDCTVRFTVDAVPDAPFYSIEVGHRGAQTFSRSDLSASAWHVDLTLGS